MLAEDKRKIANIIYSQTIKDDQVEELEHHSDYAIEAIAQEMLTAFNENDANGLVVALKSFCDIIKDDDNYKKNEELNF